MSFPVFSVKIFHRVAEHLEALTFGGLGLTAGPLRVLRRVDVTFRVRHQAQYAAGFVAQARDVCHGAVRIVGVLKDPV